ncbi:MAG TPA: sulfotransferase [Casimicrobiaceae bacterium]|nr:sulfotransferase [Casimicrobiaceae bacterium]
MSTIPIARNALCPCGSGKRFKHCHGEARSAIGDVVDFVIAGAQRSGTTSLDLHLRRHPAISMPVTRKELHFFDDDKRFRDSEVHYAAYHANFAPRHAGQLRGEVTPSYLFWPPAAERLARYNPAIKIIVVLRNPIERAHSHWNKEWQRGREALSFLGALQAERSRAQASPSGHDRRSSYLERGRYVVQLQRLWQHFPVAQTLVLRAEALLQAPLPTLEQIAQFLGVPSFPPGEPIAANVRSYARPMLRDEWEWLATRLGPEIRDLEALLGWDCAAWLIPPRFDEEQAE